MSRAVGEAFDAWAAKHPSLAAVIDRIELTRRCAESIRDTDEYRQAVESYRDAGTELDLLGRLGELAVAAISRLLSS